jgi:hypothetical protein
MGCTLSGLQDEHVHSNMNTALMVDKSKTYIFWLELSLKFNFYELTKKICLFQRPS